MFSVVASTSWCQLVELPALSSFDSVSGCCFYVYSISPLDTDSVCLLTAFSTYSRLGWFPRKMIYRGSWSSFSQTRYSCYHPANSESSEGNSRQQKITRCIWSFVDLLTEGWDSASFMSDFCWHSRHHVPLYSFQMIYPLPSSRQHLVNDDCLEDNREDYQNCSVLYCVRQLYTVICTHIWAVLIVNCCLGFTFCLELCLVLCFFAILFLCCLLLLF